MKYQYNQQDLKVDLEGIMKKYETRDLRQKTLEEEIKDNKPDLEEELTTGQAIVVLILALVMYAAVTALPTFLLMKFLNLSFWVSQLISFIGLVFVVWIFGLHKPASNKQKLQSKLF